ncbi:MAG: hypothetical protein CUN52_09405 [Phototrophicales bacterium]|nr:MAG: hypothetical protein CUN52_09405 [Phototrophicales bacterium]
MRRVVILLIVMCCLLVVVPVLGMSSVPYMGQVFMTNTPRPATDKPINFVTNTPSGPTATPSETYTPSLTPSATFTNTATFTPTFTPTATYTPTATFTPTYTPSPTPTPNGPFVYPDGVNSLTGLPYPDEAAQNRRNLIVKISNYPPVVRPQTGINLADVVFELEAEGGVTRFAAIYRSNAPTVVGSVRSARLVDIHLIRMYNALLAYSGTSEPIQNLILSSDFVYQTFSPLKGDNCENAGFCRDTSLNVDFEHTLFLNTQTLYELATRRDVNRPFRARGFAFSEFPDPNGMPAVDIYYDWWGQADARWQYDPQTGHYVRYTDGIAHYDKGDGQQIWADNLVYLEVEHRRRPDLFPPGANYESIEINFGLAEGSTEPAQGRAYVFRDGLFYTGFWRRQDENGGSAIQLIYPGAPVPIMLKPGRTWVTVVRGINAVVVSDQYTDMDALARQLALTPSPTIDPATTTGD